jgi:hypothetical protein
LLWDYLELQSVATRSQIEILAGYARCSLEHARLIAMISDDAADQYRNELIAQRKSAIDFSKNVPRAHCHWAFISKSCNHSHLATIRFRVASARSSTMRYHRCGRHR